MVRINSGLFITMKQYLDILQQILDKGITKKDRTGTGTISIFGTQSRYDLSQGFPLLTTKKMFLRGIIEELLWFIRGDTNIKYLVDRDVHIWDANAYDYYLKRYPGATETLDQFLEKVKHSDMKEGYTYGDLGPVYGREWRSWNNKVDQIQDIISQIRSNPSSRRLIVSAWNPVDVPDMALPPCHTMFQFYVRGEYLDLQLYQRSGDTFLGIPYNIASYSLLLMMVAQVCGYKPGEFIHTTGDTHLYLDHLEQAKLQLSREPRDLPKMTINPLIKDINKFQISDFTLENYNPWPSIKAKMSV